MLKSMALGKGFVLDWDQHAPPVVGCLSARKAEQIKYIYKWLLVAQCSYFVPVLVPCARRAGDNGRIRGRRGN